MNTLDCTACFLGQVLKNSLSIPANVGFFICGGIMIVKEAIKYGLDNVKDIEDKSLKVKMILSNLLEVNNYEDEYNNSIISFIVTCFNELYHSINFENLLSSFQLIFYQLYLTYSQLI